MDNQTQMDLLKGDLLTLYGKRKEERDPTKIQDIEQQIAGKLKIWGELLNRKQEHSLVS